MNHQKPRVTPSKSREPPLSVELVLVSCTDGNSRLQRAYHIIITAAAKAKGYKSAKKEE